MKRAPVRARLLNLCAPLIRTVCFTLTFKLTAESFCEASAHPLLAKVYISKEVSNEEDGDDADEPQGGVRHLGCERFHDVMGVMLAT